MKKIVIVGSGLGGLSCGASLAKLGYEVCILEQHFQIGGYATNFKRKASDGTLVEFDVSLHGIGNLSKGRELYERLQQLDVMQQLTPLRKKECGTIVNETEEIDVPDSFDAYKQHMIKRYPKYEQGIINLFNELKKLDEDMEQNVYRKNQIPQYFQELETISLYDYLVKFVDDTKFIHEFSFLWLYYGLDPKELNALYYCLAWLGYHIGGTYYIKGGANALSQAFVKVIEKHHGKIYKNEQVVEVLQEDGVVKSVKTKKQNVYEGDIFVFNGCPIELLNCMNDNEYTQQEKARFQREESSVSLTQLYLALDDKPQVYGVEKADYFYDFYKEDDFGFAHIKNANYKDTPMGIINYNILDDSLNEKAGVLAITIGDYLSNWPQDKEAYQKQKEEVTQILLERLYALFPNIKSHVIASELGTPKTMLRYTSNRDGAVYGLAQNLKLGGNQRPDNKSTLDNLFYASAWVQPGGGYEGVLRSGLMCSDRIHKTIHQVKKETNATQAKMPSHIYINGMLAQANKEVAKQISCVYELHFEDENKSYFIQVEHGNVKLIKDQKADVKITCSYDTWYKIGNQMLDGEDAYRTSLLKVKGDMKLFSYVPKLFQASKTEVEEEKICKYAPLYIPLTLVPWIVYWSAGKYIFPVLLSFLAITWVLCIQYFFKPIFMKKQTQLEGITIFSFALYGFLAYLGYETFQTYGHYINLLLPALLTICLAHNPMSGEYSQYTLPKEMVQTKLFLMINQKITLVWIFVFALQFLFVDVIFYGKGFAPIFYLLEIVGIVFSIVYPKMKLKG